jgi:hypothetical protein
MVQTVELVLGVAVTGSRAVELLSSTSDMLEETPVTASEKVRV